MNLNPEQRAAVVAGAGVWRVEAGPGAGKTRVTVERYLRLRREGFSESEILCLTFTRSAAEEMRKRAGAASGGRGGFRTFHSLAYKIILDERDCLPFTLADDPIPQNGQLPRLLRTILKGARGVTFRDARSFISLQKRAGVAPKEAIAQNGDAYGAMLAQVYAEYERQMREKGWLDFESMQTEAERLLAAKADARARWQFRWVQVDEAQDSEPLQWRLTKLLVERHGNLFCVGDANQALYGWRGAAPELFLNLEQLFPAVSTLYLGQNYRSTRAVVEFCKSIAPVRTGLVERLFSENEQGEAPEFRGFADDTAEAESIVQEIPADPEALSETVVLVRTNRQLRALEDAALDRGIKYNLLGRSGFWQQDEIQDMLAFLRVIDEPWNDEAVTRIIRSPYPCAKYIGSGLLRYLTKPFYSSLATVYSPELKSFQLEAARTLGAVLKSLREECAGKGPRHSIERVIARSGMDRYFATDDDGEEAADNSAMDNLQEAAKVALRFATIGEMLKHAQRAIYAARNAQGLTLSTIHQAKGREWGTVYVAGVSEEILPHKNGEYEEEARIFYVACSRAAKRLHITWHGRASVFIPQNSGGERAAATVPPAPAPPSARKPVRSFTDSVKRERPVPFAQIAKALDLF